MLVESSPSENVTFIAKIWKFLLSGACQEDGIILVFRLKLEAESQAYIE
jgi:hypothetical protein